MKAQTPQTKKIALRFVLAMKEIIALHRGRKERYSQGTFAESLGIDPANISKFTRYKRAPTLLMVERIISVHKVNPVWLFLGKGEMFLNDVPPAVDQKISSFERRLRKLESIAKADLFSS